ncbi:MAG TPA: 30S ribosomal protein S2 [Spirochaetota bacterium]|nr:30S ribosomal protein S2 [Spirochaetota bacterium]
MTENTVNTEYLNNDRESFTENAPVTDDSETISEISMKELLEAGVHFGHKSTNWHPKMKKYIFMKRKGVFIIDLQKTLIMAQEAYTYLKNSAANGYTILMVGTKKQAKNTVAKFARQCNIPFIANRWIGGLLTNYKTVSNSIKKLKKYEQILESDTEKKNYTKKEIAQMTRKKNKLEESFGGLKNMKGLPDMLLVIDSEYEKNAVAEANNIQIPVVGLVDTNANPDDIDVVVPGNDDAIRAINLFIKFFANAIIEGKKLLQQGITEAPSREEQSGPADDADGPDTASSNQADNQQQTAPEPESENTDKPDDTSNESEKTTAAASPEPAANNNINNNQTGDNNG